MSLPRSIFQSRAVLRSFAPDIVLGVGGYASGPVVWTAWLMGYKTAIHEQNVYPGLSNRILGKFVNRIFVSFAGSARHFPESRTVVSGNPVRKKLRLAAREKKAPATEFTLFIFGGSQGAHRLNKAMESALVDLQDLKKGLQVIHQTGEKDFSEVREAYQQNGIRAEVQPFIYDMNRAYQAADLVLCRAGATTLFELMAMGKAAILVPYPYAANDHQLLNAQTLVDLDAALMVKDDDLTGPRLSALLRQLIQEPARLRQIGERAMALAKPAAAEEIVNSCYRIVAHG